MGSYAALALRIHFTDDDLTRLRLALAPDPMWESLLSMHMLQTSDGPVVFDRWRRRTRQALTPPLAQVLRLAPPLGYSPDFLTPAAGEAGLESGIAALLRTPRRRLRQDLRELVRGQRAVPAWAHPLAEGDSGAVRTLAARFRAYFDVAVAPYWGHLRSWFTAERTARSRALVAGDISALLSGVHIRGSWAPPVLTLHGLPGNRDMYLDGRGLLVLPSFFCWRAPTVLRDPTLPPVVTYPMLHGAGADADPVAGARGGLPDRLLEPLLGRTRAVVLRTAASGLSTSEVAHAVGISPATASHHVGVLREAGLVSTQRAGSAVLHTLTPLGHALLEGRTPV